MTEPEPRNCPDCDAPLELYAGKWWHLLPYVANGSALSSECVPSLGLFEVPEGARIPEPHAEPLTRAERRNQLVARRIAAGCHPLGNLALHADAARARTGEGLRCGTCRYRETVQHHNRSYPKCMYGNGIRVSACESSDVRGWWPACADYQSKEA